MARNVALTRAHSSSSAASPLLCPPIADRLTFTSRSALPVPSPPSHPPSPSVLSPASASADLVWQDDDDIITTLCQLPLPEADILRREQLTQAQLSTLQRLQEEAQRRRTCSSSSISSSSSSSSSSISVTASDREAGETLLLAVQQLHDPLSRSVVIAVLHSLLLPPPWQAEQAEQAHSGDHWLLPLDVRVELSRCLLQQLRESLQQHEQHEQQQHEQQQQRAGDSQEHDALPPFFLAACLCDIVAALLLQPPPRDELMVELMQLQLSDVLCLSPSAATLGVLTSSLRSLRRLLQREAIFAVFVACDGVAVLSRLVLPSVPDHAYHYALAFVLLVCSFHAETHDELLDSGCVSHVLRMLGACRLERRVRLYLRLLLQLLQAGVSSEHEEQLMEAGLPSLLRSLQQQQQWRDEDVAALLSSLSGVCSSLQAELSSSSWAHFRAQLLSCSLHPSLLHSSPAFFAQHLQLFAAGHGAALKRLCALAADSRASLLTRCLAVWDLGEVAAVPGEQGKRLLESVVLEPAGRGRGGAGGAGGGREGGAAADEEGGGAGGGAEGGVRRLLLQLMETASERPLRRAAVTAMQKLLVPRWDAFRQRCRLETAVSVVRPVSEQQLSVGLQLLHSKSRQQMGGWPG